MKNKTQKEHLAFLRIHHINSKFNQRFSKVIYTSSYIVTMINTILPYCCRILLAYFINIFFNRPKVYFNILADKIGKKMNIITIAVVYITFFGIYAIVYKIIKLFENKNNHWQYLIEQENKESCYYQS
jgi:predicted PurR-regulated permease PerM